MTNVQEILTGQTSEHIHWFSDRLGIHQEMVSAYADMQLAAKKDGIELSIASGYRSFSRQLAIWQNKFSGKVAVKDIIGNSIDISTLNDENKIHAIMLFSALPGASRHHWGCDIDVYAPNLLAAEQTLQLEPWEYQENGPQFLLTRWLEKNVKRYGFYFPYDKFRGGVAAEPWHLSYAPIAEQYQQLHNEKLLADIIINSEMHGKTLLLELLPTLYQRYVSNVANAST